MESHGRMILAGEDLRTRRQTYPSATLSTTNPTWTDLGANLGLRGQRPATNNLNHDKAFHSFRCRTSLQTKEVTLLMARYSTFRRLREFFKISVWMLFLGVSEDVKIFCYKQEKMLCFIFLFYTFLFVSNITVYIIYFLLFLIIYLFLSLLPFVRSFSLSSFLCIFSSFLSSFFSFHLRLFIYLFIRLLPDNMNASEFACL
jgi:hypothetical protein